MLFLAILIRLVAAQQCTTLPLTLDDNEYTVLCPPNNITESELVNYHVIPGRIDNVQLAAPREQSIAYTLGNQTLILETAPDGGAFLVRGADWNVTSLAGNTTVGNTFIQPISKLPLAPSEVLRLSLHSTATGVSEWLKYMSDNDIDVDCEQCTLFVPTNEAIRAAALDTYTPDERRAILMGHMLQNIMYTTTIAKGDLLLTSAGNSLAFGSNDTGPFIIGNKTTAAILRTNIPARSSVIHLINAVIPNTRLLQDLADQASGATETMGIIGRPKVSSAARRRFSLW